jgi:hypothetical protein
MVEGAATEIDVTHPSAKAAGPTVGGRLMVLYTGVVVVQGIHVVEHIIQLFQVYVFNVPEDDALGLLGYVYQFQGTEEWLHLVFNSVFLASLLLIAAGLVWSRTARSAVPLWAMTAFFVFGVGLEAWHVIEHSVIISHVIANNGCPCPGILDSWLGVSDTVLHFGYNAIAFAATLLPFAFLRPVSCSRPNSSGPA